jgi:outer membrane biosynthesis protein TonB
VNETLWGDTRKPVIHSTYDAPSPCGASKPVLHAKVIALCATFEGWPENGPMYCQRTIADTEANVREVRAWIPLAISRQQRDKISEEEAQAHLIHKVRPVYPKVDGPPGKSAVKGDVVVRIFISRSGNVESIRAISGPQELSQSAINAVSLWRYRPFRASGRPIKVDTTATVHF